MLTAGLSTGAAVVVSEADPGLGRGLDLSFYEAIAPLVPLLLLAIVLENMPVYHADVRGLWERTAALDEDWQTRRQEAREAVAESEDPEVLERAQRLDDAMDVFIRSLSETRKDLRSLDRETRGYVLAFMVSAVAGEAAALYALAEQTSTTFLLMIVVGSLGFMVWMLGFFLMMRYRVRE
jgi:hypothetical protein